MGVVPTFQSLTQGGKTDCRGDLLSHRALNASRRRRFAAAPTNNRRQFNMKPESKKYSTTIGSQTVTFETGKLAGQAGGAVTFGTPNSIVFAAATMGGVRE